MSTAAAPAASTTPVGHEFLGGNMFAQSVRQLTIGDVVTEVPGFAADQHVTVASVRDLTPSVRVVGFTTPWSNGEFARELSVHAHVYGVELDYDLVRG